MTSRTFHNIFVLDTTERKWCPLIGASTLRLHAFWLRPAANLVDLARLYYPGMWLPPVHGATGSSSRRKMRPGGALKEASGGAFSPVVESGECTPDLTITYHAPGHTSTTDLRPQAAPVHFAVVYANGIQDLPSDPLVLSHTTSRLLFVAPVRSWH